MPRPPRTVFPGVALHVIQRGNDRAACFRHDADYLVYLSHLRQLSSKYECAVHAYCLMTNHVHLLITPSSLTACAGLMRDLGQRYVQYFNARHTRSGTLWEGRYRSCIVESPRYVLACYRYVELNPVRARMVNHPSGYLWSSYAANSGARFDPFLSAHSDFKALAPENNKPHNAYRALFDTEIDEALLVAIRDATNGGYPLASDSFKAAAMKPIGARVGPGKPGPKRRSGSDPELGVGINGGAVS